MREKGNAVESVSKEESAITEADGKLVSDLKGNPLVVAVLITTVPVTGLNGETLYGQEMFVKIGTESAPGTAAMLLEKVAEGLAEKDPAGFLLAALEDDPEKFGTLLKRLNPLTEAEAEGLDSLLGQLTDAERRALGLEAPPAPEAASAPLEDVLAPYARELDLGVEARRIAAEHGQPGRITTYAELERLAAGDDQDQQSTGGAITEQPGDHRA